MLMVQVSSAYKKHTSNVKKLKKKLKTKKLKNDVP